MKLKTINGRSINKNVIKYCINWHGDSKSKFQRKIKRALYPLWKNHVVFEEFPIFGTRLTVDFFNATKMIIIEVQGIFHLEYNTYFHNNRFDYLKQLRHDQDKVKFCEINNIKFVEIFPEDLKKNKNLTLFLKNMCNNV